MRFNIRYEVKHANGTWSVHNIYAESEFDALMVARLIARERGLSVQVFHGATRIKAY